MDLRKIHFKNFFATDKIINQEILSLKDLKITFLRKIMFNKKNFWKGRSVARCREPANVIYCYITILIQPEKNSLLAMSPYLPANEFYKLIKKIVSWNINGRDKTLDFVLKNSLNADLYLLQEVKASNNLMKKIDNFLIKLIKLMEKKRNILIVSFL